MLPLSLYHTHWVQMVSLQRYLQGLEVLVEDPWSQNNIDYVLREVFQQVKHVAGSSQSDILVLGRLVEDHFIIRPDLMLNWEEWVLQQPEWQWT